MTAPLFEAVQHEMYATMLLFEEKNKMQDSEIQTLETLCDGARDAQGLLSDEFACVQRNLVQTVIKVADQKSSEQKEQRFVDANLHLEATLKELEEVNKQLAEKQRIIHQLSMMKNE